MEEKRIIFKHKPALLENYKTLAQSEPKEYQGFIYLWRCVPEDMYYIGSHKGKSYDDYRGSGTRFKYAYDYHGATKFERIVLEYLADTKNIKEREQDWMTKFNAVKSQWFYNMRNVRR